MTKAVLWAVAALLSLPVVAQNSNVPQSGMSHKVVAADVWQMPASFITDAHKACDAAKQPPSYGECFIAQMSKAGAPAGGVAFSQMLYKGSNGDVGILTGLHPVGPVDVAWITYPLRANTNTGLLLVNGSPEIVNAEDLQQLDQNDMKQSPQFQDLLNQFPKVGIWPGDRDGKTWPSTQQGPDGGTQFVLGYPLINGCHACARAGFALFTWNFTPQGKFTGTSFLGMTPAPLSGSITPPSQ